MKNVFISYRREDSADFVHGLTSTLKKLLPTDRIFVDVTGIDPASNFVEALEKALDNCDAALIVIGPRWFGVDARGERRIDQPSDFVRLEAEHLLARKIPVIPVLVHGARMPAQVDLPSTIAALAELQAVVLTGGPEDFPEVLVDAVLRILRQWKVMSVRNESGTTVWTHSWRDLTWLTDTEGWLCGSISDGGGGGHVGYGVLLRTTDGGATWRRAQKIHSGRGEFNWGGYRYNWTDVGPINSILLYARERTEGEVLVNGYIATMTGVYRATAPRLRFTEDLEWERSTPLPGGLVPFTHFGSMANIEGDNELYVAGWPGIVNWVRNGEWALQMKTFTHPITMVAVTGGSDNRSVWAVGRAGTDDYGNWGSASHGALYHLEWPANRWERVPLPEIEFEEAQNLTALHIVDPSHLLLVGEKGLVIQGARDRQRKWTWRRIPVPSTATFNCVFANELGLWIVGAQGTILNSVDNGQHWTLLSVNGIDNGLDRIRFFGETGWILGHNTLLKCT